MDDKKYINHHKEMVVYESYPKEGIMTGSPIYTSIEIADKAYANKSASEQRAFNPTGCLLVVREWTDLHKWKVMNYLFAQMSCTDLESEELMSKRSLSSFISSLQQFLLFRLKFCQYHQMRIMTLMMKSLEIQLQ
eukprot:683343-Ditylum_brightwellii.AAC.1